MTGALRKRAERLTQKRHGGIHERFLEAMAAPEPEAAWAAVCASLSPAEHRRQAAFVATMTDPRNAIG